MTAANFNLSIASPSFLLFATATNLNLVSSELVLKIRTSVCIIFVVEAYRIKVDNPWFEDFELELLYRIDSEFDGDDIDKDVYEVCNHDTDDDDDSESNNISDELEY